jgi:spore germination cell wall hydrolase CwlJ-like protein
MVPSRNGPKGAEVASFGLAILIFALTPTPVGYQDLAGLVAQQPAVAARWREHQIASPFGTIHAATFSLPRPVGTSMPEPPTVRLASLNTGDVTGSVDANSFALRRAPQQVVFPTINRIGKGDRLVPSVPAEPPSSDDPVAPDAAAPADAVAPVPAEAPKPSITPSRPKAAEIDHTDSELPDAQAVVLAEIARDTQRRNAPAAKPDEIAAAMHFAPFPEYDIALSLEHDPKIVIDEPVDLADLDPTEFTPNAPANLEGLNAEVKESRLFFGHDLFGTDLLGIRPWASGEEPRMPADPDLKQTPPAAIAAQPGVTVAGKGEVTGEDRRPKTPAERLSLAGGKRAKAEKCLANAVYFESRSEPVRGQIAVAQVVMNRAFSGFYPNDVCGVVYQNAHRHLACQFTFACDGIADVVNDPDSWERAKRIAQETLDGKLWLPEIGKSTHYHASYVSPYWVRAMKKHAKIGLHHFYRPRRWGNGEEAPSWGNAIYTADAAAKM